MLDHLRSAGVRSFLSLNLAFLLGLPPGTASAAQLKLGAPAKLNVVILEGEGAINNIRQPAASELAVRVEDESHRPVARAAVLFTLPDSGPSGAFADAGRTLLVRTDNAGRAAAKGLRANGTQGKFEIQVRASFGSLTANASITQVNSVVAGVTRKRRFSGKLIAVLSGIGAAVAVGLVVATRNGSASSTSIEISPGSPSVGGPH
jgi:hypothetical protein